MKCVPGISWIVYFSMRPCERAL